MLQGRYFVVPWNRQGKPYRVIGTYFIRGLCVAVYPVLRFCQGVVYEFRHAVIASLVEKAVSVLIQFDSCVESSAHASEAHRKNIPKMRIIDWLYIMINICFLLVGGWVSYEEGSVREISQPILRLHSCNWSPVPITIRKTNDFNFRHSTVLYFRQLRKIPPWFSSRGHNGTFCRY